MEFVRFIGPLIDEFYLQSFVQKRQLSQPLAQCFKVEVNGFEHLFIWPESDFCPCLLRRADLLQFRDSLSPLIALGINSAVSFDLKVEPFREGVHHRHTDTMESA